MKLNYRLIVSLVLVSVLSVASLSMICWAADETPFMTVTLKDIRFDEVGGTDLVNGGSEVSITLIMTNVSKELDRSTLTFHSELERAVGTISGEGLEEQALTNGGSYTLQHKKVAGDLKVTCSGEAPEVGKRESLTFLNLTQETTEGTYTVSLILKDVSSQTIENAIVAFDTATKAIAEADTAITDAEERGLDVEEAKNSLALANEYLSNAQQLYYESKAEDALEEAENAVNAAQEAEAKASAAVSGRSYLNYGIIAAVIIVAIVVFMLLLQQRKRKRGVY
ncbi:MAG: hypothetical protein JW945_03720 [Methanomicrobia archaeon]|nr:hypothetical protein [Methanomicrobia archaeon]